VTIEERLEKLTERHEALTQTVESIAAMQKANEERAGETGTRLAQVLEAITKLGDIAEAQEHRLDSLEDRPH
jgi:chromosome segregation ATPase